MSPSHIVEPSLLVHMTWDGSRANERGISIVLVKVEQPTTPKTELHRLDMNFAIPDASFPERDHSLHGTLQWRKESIWSQQRHDADILILLPNLAPMLLGKKLCGFPSSDARFRVGQPDPLIEQNLWYVRVPFKFRKWFQPRQFREHRMFDVPISIRLKKSLSRSIFSIWMRNAFFAAGDDSSQWSQTTVWATE